MKPVQVALWVSIAFLLGGQTKGVAEVCHSALRFVKGTSIVTINYQITNPDVERAPNPFYVPNFDIYYHPFGEATAETRTVGSPVEVTRELGPVWEDSCGIGDDENAGYQLMIFSKQDPRTELFDKPILVTQGFDAGYRTDDQFDFDKFTLTLNRVFENDDTDLTKLARETSLLKQLYDEGYDIALLLWKNPTTFIQVNATVTLQALRWLQTHTDTTREGTEPVIIGPSMGGLVTRFALQFVGRFLHPPDIRVRLFIALDSPNLGAEIPMSIQALVSYFRDRGYDQERTFKNLTSVAARQLLLSSVLDKETGKAFQEVANYEAANCQEGDDRTCHGKFVREINDSGFRGQIKNIVHSFAGSQEPIYTAAIINGSGNGIDLQLPEGATYLHMSHTTLGVELRTAGANQRVRVTHADRATKDGLDYDFRELAFIEDTPGGLRDTYLVIRKSLNNRGYSWNKFLNDNVVNHSFVPSFSGVGLLDRAVNEETSWFAAVGIAGACTVGPTCMFDEFHAPVSNQVHVTVTRENKQWFLDLIHRKGPQGPRQPVQPIWEAEGFVCVLDRPPYPVRGSFGYDNPNAFNVTIPIGANNHFVGRDPSRGQPELFLPGRHYGVIRFSSSEPDAWHLDGTTAEPEADIRRCGLPPNNPALPFPRPRPADIFPG